MKPVTLHYSEALVRRAIKAFWWRRTGWSYFLGYGLMMVSFGLLIWSGDHSWKIGVLGSVIGISVLAAANLYLVHYRASFARFRRMAKPEATMILGENCFRITSDIGSTETNWNMVKELWCFHEFWLIFFSPAQFMTLPTADFDRTTREFIVTKLAALAIKIRWFAPSQDDDNDLLTPAASRQAILDAFDDDIRS